MRREAAHDSCAPLAIGNDSRRSSRSDTRPPSSDHHGQDVASAQIARSACVPSEGAPFGHRARRFVRVTGFAERRACSRAVRRRHFIGLLQRGTRRRCRWRAGRGRRGRGRGAWWFVGRPHEDDVSRVLERHSQRSRRAPLVEAVSGQQGLRRCPVDPSDVRVDPPSGLRFHPSIVAPPVNTRIGNSARATSQISPSCACDRVGGSRLSTASRA